MAGNYAQLLDIINNPTNHSLPAWDNNNKLIEGLTVKQYLLTIINSLTVGYQFMGVASTDTSGGTPDQNVFYIAGAGTYNGFGSNPITIDAGYIGIIRWNGAWSSDTIKIADAVSVTQNSETGGYDLTVGNDVYKVAKQSDLLNLEDKVGKAINVDYWDLSKRATLMDGYIFNGNGESQNDSFFIIKGIEYQEGATDIYFLCEEFVNVYNTTGYNDAYSARMIRFRDVNGDLVSIDTSYIRSPYTIPSGTKYIDICFPKIDTTTLGYYWATFRSATEHYDKVFFNQLINSMIAGFGIELANEDNKVKISSYIKDGNITKLYPKTKLPVVCFTFDDLPDNDDLIVELFNQKHLTCGFAYISGIPDMAEKYAKYKKWQQAYGYQIMNHGSIKITGSGNSKPLTTDNYTYAEAMSVILESLENIKNDGCICNSWVTPDAEFDASFQPIIELCHAYCFPFTNQVSANQRNSDIALLRRTAMQGKTLAELKSDIDNAITNDNLLVFYGHSWALVDGGTTDQFSIAQISAILDYCVEKRNAGLVWLGGVDEGIKYYYDL